MSILKFLFKSLFRSLFFSAVLSLSLTALAENTDFDATDSETMAQAMKLVQEKMASGDYDEGSENYKKAQGAAKKYLGRDVDMKKLQKLTASLIRSVSSQNGGDMAETLKQLQKAQQNPEQFHKNLTPEQKKLMQEMGLATP